MSLIVTVSTKEGVVMASDSRVSLSQPIIVDSKVIASQLYEISDTAYKTFLFRDNVGISTCGGAHVSGISVAAHLENIRLNVRDNNLTIDGVCCEIERYFLGIQDCPEIIFHVAGYDLVENAKILTARKLIIGGARKFGIKKDIPTIGASWDGETATMSRIMKAGYMVGSGNARRLGQITITNTDAAGIVSQECLRDRIVIPGISPWHPDLEVCWDFFTLQDGIDFARYAIRTTIDTMRFQATPKTVGGPIDILTISPIGARWISRKELH